VRDDERAAAQYDAMAAAYAADGAENVFNASYERPATIGLLGDVRGKRILEVGCGAGILTEYLVESGADVVELDVSAGDARPRLPTGRPACPPRAGLA
jgi:2-polyprenyl-3-methyl-5-hydroxy-6-metoxy-1,4-benzoquinol methylase